MTIVMHVHVPLILSGFGVVGFNIFLFEMFQKGLYNEIEVPIMPENISQSTICE